MVNQILNYHKNILESLNSINDVINNTNYTEYELSINNNIYESLSNNFLKTYNSILDNIIESLKNIKKQNKKYTKYKNTIINKFDTLLINIDKLNINIDNSNFIIENETITNINTINNNYEYKIFNTLFLNNNNNLDIIDNNDILKNFLNNNIINNDYEQITIPKKQLVNIGFENYYELPVYSYLSINIPLNIIVFIDEIKSVVIKVGNSKIKNLPRPTNLIKIKNQFINK